MKNLDRLEVIINKLHLILDAKPTATSERDFQIYQIQLQVNNLTNLYNREKSYANP